MTDLFDPLVLRGVTLKNRIGVSPMCQYSAVEGAATDWHLVHLGARAVGGAGLVMAEATAVEARGRISPADLGLWSDDHIPPLERVARFLRSQGAVPAIQLAHAGRKASHSVPWDGDAPLPEGNGGWRPMGPSPIPFAEGDQAPLEMTADDIAAVLGAFRSAAVRARDAGFDMVELHAAHGYLAHSFYSPLSNFRTDDYGGSFENRIRFLMDTFRAIRSAWPEEKPVAVRLSCSDWVVGGWTLEDTVSLARKLKLEGADLIDCSSGGAVPHAKIPVGPSFQVPFAQAVRDGAHIPTAAVGFITEAEQAEEIVTSGKADMVLLAREELRDPYWPIHAAQALGIQDELDIPPQYWRAIPGKHTRRNV
jgi:2,4-dienoyl-CoA reductase-like NADH-dependent reductase (Old Yellow Enzyme family)